MGILDGKVAIVTGSGRGIGRGIVLAMAAEGAKVVVNDYGVKLDGTEPTGGPADEVVQEVKQAGGTAVANYDSVATVEGGEKIIKTAIDNFGKLDILVNCAGILRDRMFFNMAEEEWDAVIATHLKGTFCTSKPACVFLRQQGSGRIINFSSTSGLIGNAGQANYGMAKGGISGFTKVVARDMGRYGVTCNCIVPTAMTRMVASIPTRPGGGGPPPWMMAPEAVAPIVVWLASDQAANINGQFFGAQGGTISLYSQPRPIVGIYKDIQKNGFWTLDELDEIAPRTVCANLVNPAPPQPPQQ
ncbi:MAG: 3-hydroxyacyl-CoA dehydrogenase [Chloroflexi bacterium RBG_13_54_9]|nr:MAG: 3-hydroxyacyl-CoA dehydrogenase [Chloroflexi bacterium RBG_13_54_9]